MAGKGRRPGKIPLVGKVIIAILVLVVLFIVIDVVGGTTACMDRYEEPAKGYQATMRRVSACLDQQK